MKVSKKIYLNHLKIKSRDFIGIKQMGRKRIHKCCNERYCNFPAWHGTTCIFCGASCLNCEIGDKLKS